MQKKAKTKAPNTKKLLETRKSSIDWMSPMPGMETPESTENPKTQGRDAKTSSGALQTTARLRVMFHWSMEKRRMFSNTAMTVESAAKAMHKKKSVPHSCPKGICWKTAGRVRNTRLGPEVGLTPNAKHAGKMIRPAMMATRVSRPAICTASLVILWSRAM